MGSVSIERRSNGGLSVVERTHFKPGERIAAELLLEILLAWKERTI